MGRGVSGGHSFFPLLELGRRMGSGQARNWLASWLDGWQAGVCVVYGAMVQVRVCRGAVKEAGWNGFPCLLSLAIHVFWVGSMLPAVQVRGKRGSPSGLNNLCCFATPHLQAFLTVVGNTTCLMAAYRIYEAAQAEAKA